MFVTSCVVAVGMYELKNACHEAGVCGTQAEIIATACAFAGFVHADILIGTDDADEDDEAPEACVTPGPKKKYQNPRAAAPTPPTINIFFEFLSIQFFYRLRITATKQIICDRRHGCSPRRYFSGGSGRRGRRRRSDHDGRRLRLIHVHQHKHAYHSRSTQ
jgi:hypothetical protein